MKYAILAPLPQKHHKKRKKFIIRADDLHADIQMYFRQIIALVDLLVELDETCSLNMFTIKELAEAGLEKTNKL